MASQEQWQRFFYGCMGREQLIEHCMVMDALVDAERRTVVELQKRLAGLGAATPIEACDA